MIRALIFLLLVDIGDCSQKEARDVSNEKPTVVYCSTTTSLEKACAAFDSVYSNSRVSLQSDELMAAIIYEIDRNPALAPWQEAMLNKTLEQKELPRGTVIRLDVVSTKKAVSVSEIQRITLCFGCVGLFNGVSLGKPDHDQQKKIFSLVVRQMAKIDK